LTVSLAPGWGAEFRVRSLDGEPVPGARVFLDGKDHGVTGADGNLRIVLGAPPTAADVRHPAWVMIGPGIDPETGAINSLAGSVLVLLVPPD